MLYTLSDWCSYAEHKSGMQRCVRWWFSLFRVNSLFFCLQILNIYSLYLMETNWKKGPIQHKSEQQIHAGSDSETRVHPDRLLSSQERTAAMQTSRDSENIPRNGTADIPFLLCPEIFKTNIHHVIFPIQQPLANQRASCHWCNTEYWLNTQNKSTCRIKNKVKLTHFKNLNIK